jgi:hypothetical protein
MPYLFPKWTDSCHCLGHFFKNTKQNKNRAISSNTPSEELMSKKRVSISIFSCPFNMKIHDIFPVKRKHNIQTLLGFFLPHIVHGLNLLSEITNMTDGPQFKSEKLKTIITMCV